MTTGKTIALTIQTFVRKVMSLLFIMLSRFVIAFLPRSKSLFLHLNLKVSILWHVAFFMVQLSHPYLTTGKTIALTTQNFVGIVMPLLLVHQSRLWFFQWSCMDVRVGL